MKSAKDLPHCAMSEAIEMGLLQMLDQAYSDKAKELKCSVDQVDKADSLCVRVVSSMDKKHMVRDEVRRMHCILLNYIFGQFHQCFDDTFKIFCMIYPDVRSLCQEGLPIRVCCKIQVHPPFSEHSWSGCSPVWHVCLWIWAFFPCSQPAEGIYILPWFNPLFPTKVLSYNGLSLHYCGIHAICKAQRFSYGTHLELPSLQRRWLHLLLPPWTAAYTPWWYAVFLVP